MVSEQEAAIPVTPNSFDEPVIFTPVSQVRIGIQDVIDGIKKWRIWFMLAYQDIKLRYRRSFIGPFWLTISMAVTVYSMGYLYGHLFHIDLATYYPYLVGGMLGWSLISTMVIEYTDGLLSAESLIKQVKLPYSVHIHRIAARNMLIFFHNIIVLIPILIIFHETTRLHLYSLLLIPALCLIYINAFLYGFILAMLGARYRDISPVIKSLVQVVFFVTPVMWSPSVLSEKRLFFVNFNPFYAYLEILRQPLLGHLPTMYNLIVVLFMTAIGAVVCATLFIRYRSRIIYWL